MGVADGIAKLGFRKWYERQLIESHAYLVTCFLCMIAVAALLEVFFDPGPPMRRAGMAAGAFVACVIGYGSWHRYKAILARAEWVGDHATCPDCDAYARFRVLSSRPRAAPPGQPPRDEDDDDAGPPPHGVPHLGVECKKCGRGWTI